MPVMTGEVGWFAALFVGPVVGEVAFGIAGGLNGPLRTRAMMGAIEEAVVLKGFASCG